MLVKNNIYKWEIVELVLTIEPVHNHNNGRTSSSTISQQPKHKSSQSPYSKTKKVIFQAQSIIPSAFSYSKIIQDLFSIQQQSSSLPISSLLPQETSMIIFLIRTIKTLNFTLQSMEKSNNHKGTVYKHIAILHNIKTVQPIGN